MKIEVRFFRNPGQTPRAEMHHVGRVPCLGEAVSLTTGNQVWEVVRVEHLLSPLADDPVAFVWVK